MSEWNYFVTAQRPTAVKHAVGPMRFTSTEPGDLVVARTARLEVYRPSPERGGTLELVCGFQVNGRIAVLQAVLRPSRSHDWLLLCTPKRQLVVLRYDVEAGRPATVALGSLHDAAARPVDTEPLCAFDPVSQVAALYLYEGLLKVAKLENVETLGETSVAVRDMCAEGDIFGTRLAEPRVLDIAFLHEYRDNDCDDTVPNLGGSAGSKKKTSDAVAAPEMRRPLLAVLHADGQGARFVAVWGLDLQGHGLLPVPAASGRSGRRLVAVEAGSSRVIAVPPGCGGGALVIGGTHASYLDGGGNVVASKHGGPSEVAALVCLAAMGDGHREDAPRWVVSDADGNLWLLRLQASMPAVLFWESVGLFSPARALVCLSEERLFVGSAVGDSQLLRLGRVAATTAVACGGRTGKARKGMAADPAVLETWTNLGPVLDFCIADADDKGQSQIVTCSGVGHTGSLRFVRVGIGVAEFGSLCGFGGVLGMWALGGDRTSGAAAMLALSFVNATRILVFAGSASASAEGASVSGNGDKTGGVPELAECEAPGFAEHEESLLICEAVPSSSGVVLQVTRSGVHAATWETLAAVAQWRPPDGCSVQVAAAAFTGGEDGGDDANGGCALPSRNNVAGILLGFANGELMLLRFEGSASSRTASKFQVESRWQLGGEVACLHASWNLVVAGLWTKELRVLRLGCDATVGTAAAKRKSTQRKEKATTMTVKDMLMMKRKEKKEENEEKEGEKRQGGNEDDFQQPSWIVEALPTDTLPRSVVVARLAGVLHLLVGLGDGRLVTFQVDEMTGTLSQRRAVCLGAQPAQLVPFRSRADGLQHVFATGDRPTVVHAHSRLPTVAGLAYATVNMRQISHVAAFDGVGAASARRAPRVGALGGLSGCMAFVSERRLVLGSLEEIQRVHMKTLSLGESPTRISYQRQAGILAVACMPQPSLGSPEGEAQASVVATGAEDERVDSRQRGIDPTKQASPTSTISAAAATAARGKRSAEGADVSESTAVADATGSSVKIIHRHTLETLQVLRMQLHETVASLCAATLQEGGPECLVVGTAFVLADEPEPSRGRVLVYTPQEQGTCSASSSTAKCVGTARYSLICEMDVRGSVYSVLPFRNMLLGSVNNRVTIWKWRPENSQFESVCSHGGSIIALYLQTIGDRILVGDLMRSASLLRFDAESEKLEEVAHDAGTAWLTSTAMLTEDLCLCTDDSENIFTLGKGRAAAGDRPDILGEDIRSRLERVGQMHTGEFVNRMQKATLVEHPAVATDAGCSVDTPASEHGAGLVYTPVAQVVWASVDGAIGLIASLRSEREFARLSLIQDAISQEIPKLEGLPHGEWRDCWADHRGKTPHGGFIDGDLVEALLELPRAKQQAVVDRLRNMKLAVDGVEDLLREIQEFAQLH